MSESNLKTPAVEERFRKAKRWLAFAAVLTIFLGVMRVGNWFAGKPQNLGVIDGRLSNCSDAPNCVCSQEPRESHHVEPLEYTGDADAAWIRLVELIKAQPRAKVITLSDGYLHAEFTTAVLRFVDDVEFWQDRESRKIHIRSASRVGYSDMGKNRTRVEELRAAFQASE